MTKQDKDAHLSFGECYICQKAGSNVYDAPGVAHHSECTKCHKCGSQFVFWSGSSRPFIFRCLNCLERWQID